MNYIAAKHYDRIGIDGRFDVPENAELQEEGNILRFNGKRVCFNTSFDAFEFFAKNDDGKGLKRHELTHKVLAAVKKMKTDYEDDVAKALSKFERDENGNLPEEAAAAAAAVENKAVAFFDAMLADGTFKGYLTNGNWNRNFFEARIIDLNRLCKLL